MVLTCAKPAKSITSTPTLYNIPLEQVDAFTYLGVLISANMSWGPHIEAITSKSKRILGALYRRYYAHCSSKILLKLYTAYVRPRLEYVSYVWDSSTQKHINQLEKVQKFVLKMCYKKWSSSYSHLLEVAQLPTLEVRRRVSKLCTLFKISNQLIDYPALQFQHPTQYDLRGRHPHQLALPSYVRTDLIKKSFKYTAIVDWNALPPELIRCSFKTFKNNLYLAF